MNNEIPKHVKDKIQADAEKFRDKHTIWKCSLYASLLTTNTLLIGATPFICDTTTILGKAISTIVILACLVSTICIVRVMMFFVHLYDVLGFTPTINTVDDADREEKRQRDDDTLNKHWPKRRIILDRTILWCSFGSIYLIGIAAIYFILIHK